MTFEDLCAELVDAINKHYAWLAPKNEAVLTWEHDTPNSDSESENRELLTGLDAINCESEDIALVAELDAIRETDRKAIERFINKLYDKDVLEASQAQRYLRVIGKMPSGRPVVSGRLRSGKLGPNFLSNTDSESSSDEEIKLKQCSAPNLPSSTDLKSTSSERQGSAPLDIPASQHFSFKPISKQAIKKENTVSAQSIQKPANTQQLANVNLLSSSLPKYKFLTNKKVIKKEANVGGEWSEEELIFGCK